MGQSREDASPGTGEHHNSNEPVNFVAPKENQLSNQCTFLPIYGLFKHMFEKYSTTS